VASPDPLSATPSISSAMKTPDPQSLGPSVSLVEIEEAPQNAERDPNDPKPAAEGDIQGEETPD
jgi:hypothetical protein